MRKQRLLAAFLVLIASVASAAPSAQNFMLFQSDGSTKRTDSSTIQPLFQEVGIGSAVLTDDGIGNLVVSTGSVSQSLVNGKILVGNVSNQATAVTPSGDVTITNAGVTAVGTVGGSTAANVHSAELAANAATDTNTASTIVKRDSGGSFSMGVLTATSLVDTFTNTAASGTFAGLQINATYNQTASTAANTDLLISRTETAVGSGAQKLIDAQVASSSKFSVLDTGAMTVAGATTLSNLGTGVVHASGVGLLTSSSVSLTADVSGTLPVGNGGTGLATTPTDGQLLVGKTATNGYVQATLTGTTNEISVANGSGTITLSTPQAIATSSSPTFAGLTLTSPLAIGSGGTNAATASAAFNNLSPMTAAGDLIYGGTVGAGTRLAAGTSVQVLHSGTTPTWGAVALTTDVSGVLPTANGGTGQNSTATFPTSGTVLTDTNTVSPVTNKTISALSNTLSNLIAEYDLACDGATTTFTLAGQNLLATNHVLLYVDGRLQRSGLSNAYTTATGTTNQIVFTVAPSASSWCHAVVVNQ